MRDDCGMGCRYLRDALAESLADASHARIHRVLGAELAEGLDDIARIARAAVPYVQKAAPAVLQGAATGFLTGGPAGALVGGAAGGISSLGVGAAPSAGMPARAGAPPGAPAAGASAAIANPAALQLVLALLRPEVIDALIAMGFGREGARQVPIAGTSVPVAAYANLIQSLAEDALATHHPIARDSGVPRYLSEAIAGGEDISHAHVRARALHSLVREAWQDDAALPEDIDEDAEQRDIDDIDRLGGLDP